MSLTLNVVPSPQQQIDSLRRELEMRTRELQETREALREERMRSAQAAQGAEQLRSVLSPLYQALRRVFGELDTFSVEAAPSSLDPRKAQVWEAWKERMPGLPAKFIDALLLHGALTQTQLRIHAQCATGSVAGVVSQLWRAGLINKNNGKISLKEL